MVSTKLRLKELLRQRRWTTKVLAEKTGMSESYLTHIKNGTRRWNEDALKKMAHAFDLEPIDLLADRKVRSTEVKHTIAMPTEFSDQKVLRVVPVMSAIPSHPTPFNNRVQQVKSGYQNEFVPVINSDDLEMFCLSIADDSLEPEFFKNDRLIISPQVEPRSGDIAAVEYQAEGTVKRAVKKVTYTDGFIVLDSINHSTPPIALVRGRDLFKIIGKVIYRYQNF